MRCLIWCKKVRVKILRALGITSILWRQVEFKFSAWNMQMRHKTRVSDGKEGELAPLRDKWSWAEHGSEVRRGGRCAGEADVPLHNISFVCHDIESHKSSK